MTMTAVLYARLAVNRAGKTSATAGNHWTIATTKRKRKTKKITKT
jgi:hypothetical protein